MPLPQTVRVKLSSEAAEAISLTPVVVQDLPTIELIEHILGITGLIAHNRRLYNLRWILVGRVERTVTWEALKRCQDHT